MIYLLDISTLLAWLLERHTANAAVRRWERGKDIWICPLTELGFVRIACNTYSAALEDAYQLLEEWRSARKPGWIQCDLSLRNAEAAPSWQKLTDFYLADLAKKHGMKLATLDRGISHEAVEAIA